MGMVTDLVSTADGMLGSAASTMFGDIVTVAGPLIAAMSTLAVVLLAVNVMVQWRPFTPAQLLTMVVKLLIVGYVGLQWSNFNVIYDAISKGTDSLAGVILGGYGSAPAPSGGGTIVVSSTLAGAVDNFLTEFSTRSNAALEPLSWYGSALMGVLITLLISLIGCAAALILLFSKVMLSVFVGIAPVFIALSIFEATKDYFHRWLQSTITFLIYPIVIAGVLGAITRFVQAYIGMLSTDVSSSISAFIPFIASLLIMLTAIIFIPIIVNGLSGMIATPNPVVAGLALKSMGSAAAQYSGANKVASAATGAAVGKVREYGGLARDGGLSLASRIAARTARFK